MLDSPSDSCIKDSPLSEHSFFISGRDGNITYMSGRGQVLMAHYWEGLIHWPSTSLLLSKLWPFGFSEVSLFLTLSLWGNIASFLLALLSKVQCEWEASEVIKSFVPPLWVLHYWKWEKINVKEGGKHIICAGPQAWPRSTFLCSLQEFPYHTLSLFQNGMLLCKNSPTA